MEVKEIILKVVVEEMIMPREVLPEIESLVLLVMIL